MIKTSRLPCFALLVFATCAAPGAGARSLVDRLPSGSALFGSVDLDAVRRSPLIGQDVTSSPLPKQAGDLEGILRAAGIDVRRDVAQLAFGVLPKTSDKGTKDDFVVVASGKLDPARLRAAALSHGASAAKLGDVAAVKLPRSATEGEAAYLSFVDGLAVLGSAQASKLVHQASAPGPRMPAAIPTDAVAWLAGDLGQLDAKDVAATTPAASQVQRIQLWARLADTVELGAVADAADAQAATQLAGMAQLAAGIATLAGAPAGSSVLSGLKVGTVDRRITASLAVTKAQLDALRAEAARPPEPAPSSTPSSSGGTKPTAQ